MDRQAVNMYVTMWFCKFAAAEFWPWIAEDRHDFEKASTLQNFVELWKCLLNELFISCYPKSLNSYKSSSVFSNSCRLEYMHFAVR